MVTSVVRFGAGQWKLYKSELRKLDVHCRKLLRQVVGPPGSIDWTQPWHSILHQWNQRVVEQMQLNGFELWSNRCMLDYWKFVQYVAVLDDSRWLKRALTWNAGGGRRGRSFDLWDARVTKFCRWQNIGEWQVAAQDKVLWLQYLPDFITFYAFVIYLLGLTPCALNGLPYHGIQVQSQKSKSQSPVFQ